MAATTLVHQGAAVTTAAAAARADSSPAAALSSTAQGPRKAWRLRLSHPVSSSGRSTQQRPGVAQCSLAGSAGGSFDAGQPEDPYKVLGVSPLEGFDAAKTAYRKKSKEAEAKGDEAAMERIERAYDAIMMRQLNQRKQGVTFGSLKVSEDIKYADKEDWFPWRPRPERSGKRADLLNRVVSFLLALWAFSTKTTEWKAMQFLVSYYVFALFMKLDPFFPRIEEDGEKKWKRNGRRLVRSLSLVFGVVAVASFAHTVAISGYSFLGLYVPRELFEFQEAFITVLSSIGLYIIGSFYR